MLRIKTCEELCFNPSRPDLGWRQTISLNFYFHSFLRCFRSFYEGLKGIWTYFTPCSSVSVVNFWAGKCQLGWVQTIPPQNLKLNYCHLSDWILLEISQGDYLAWKLQLLTSGSWTMLIYKEFSVQDFNGNCCIHLIYYFHVSCFGSLLFLLFSFSRLHLYVLLVWNMTLSALKIDGAQVGSWDFYSRI